MRGIKFRGYNKKLKQWFYGYLFILPDKRHFIRVINDAPDKFGNAYFDMLVEKDSVGQFTELKDKNKNEIYEGDILDDVDRTSPAKVVYDNKKGAYFLVHLSSDEKGFDDYICNFDLPILEVIGNIYENRELMEQGE